MTDIQPGWVYDVIAAIDDYEQIHGEHDNGWPCLDTALALVPKRELDRARAIATYKRQQPAPEPVVIHRTEYTGPRNDALNLLFAAARANPGR